MRVEDILKNAVEKNASDIFIVTGQAVSFKINGLILPEYEEKLMPKDTETLIEEIYQLAGRNKFADLDRSGDDDFSFSLRGVGRFRVNAYKQRGSLSAVLRVVLFDLMDPSELGIPPQVMDLSTKTSGMILVTGPAGSGKSTTLACIIDQINKTRNCHIMTLEDPIEFLHRHNKSIVSQREIYLDTESYVKALRAALRQAPDVILIGEMRDVETMSIAMTAAETGHLVLSTLHTLGAANSVDRIVDTYPPSQQVQARMQLSMILQAVVSQQLLPGSSHSERWAAFEIMMGSNAIRNLVRDGKTHQIENVIYSSADMGMQTMDSSILQLYKKKAISRDTAIVYSMNKEAIIRQLDLADKNK